MRSLGIIACVVLGSCGGDRGPKPSAAAADGPAPGSERSVETVEAAGADEVTIHLHNLCPRAVTYAVVGEDVRPTDEDAKVIEPEVSIEVTIAKGDRVVRRNDDGTWGGSAMTDVDGGHVVFTSSCNGMAASDLPDTDPRALDGMMRPDR